MREQELDKFVGKLVRVLDFENEENVGFFYKIKDHKTHEHGIENLHSIKTGYYLSRFGRCGIDYRKSHIKKIQLK